MRDAVKTSTILKTQEASFADACNECTLKMKTMMSLLSMMNTIYSWISEKKTIYFETVRLGVLFLQTQTLFSERPVETR